MHTQTPANYVLNNKNFVVRAADLRTGNYSTAFPVDSLFRDGESENQSEVMEQYFHDLYGVFLKKLTTLATDANIGELESLHLKAMLDELLRVKVLIEKDSK